MNISNLFFYFFYFQLFFFVNFLWRFEGKFFWQVQYSLTKTKCMLFLPCCISSRVAPIFYEFALAETFSYNYLKERVYPSLVYNILNFCGHIRLKKKIIKFIPGIDWNSIMYYFFSSSFKFDCLLSIQFNLKLKIP